MAERSEHRAFSEWHQSAVDVLMEAGLRRGYLGLAENEYGTTVSVHRCTACGEPFTNCPVVSSHPGNDLCNQPECPEYDPDRDVEELMKRGHEVRPEDDGR